MKPTITEAEKREDFSELFYKPMEPVDPSLLKIMGESPIDSAKATAIENRNELLKPGYLEVENGYCRMPDGSGFVATKVEMPGVTPEMIDWWFIWHGLKDLRYKVWCPTQHYGIHVMEKDLAHRLDQSLSMKERNWGTTDVVTEDVGSGPQEMHLTFLSPADYGYDPELVKNADTIISANVTDPKTGIGQITFSHIVRKIPGGIEYRSRYWQGYSMINGKPVPVSVPKGGFPIEVMKGNAYHSLDEYHNLAAILPKLYGMYKDRPDRLQDYMREQS